MDHAIPHLKDLIRFVNGASSYLFLSLPVCPMQGSVIGCLLFIFYINDITPISLSDGTLSQFADDMLLYHPIRSPVDYQHLQIDIDCLCDWTDLKYLQFLVLCTKKKKKIKLEYSLFLVRLVLANVSRSTLLLKFAVICRIACMPTNQWEL